MGAKFKVLDYNKPLAHFSPWDDGRSESALERSIYDLGAKQSVVSVAFAEEHCADCVSRPVFGQVLIGVEAVVLGMRGEATSARS